MKALSIKQPWASLIAHGIKNIENRMWKTHFRGKIYIHASGNKVKSEDFGVMISTEMYLDYAKKLRKKGITERSADFLYSQPTSAIIGEVEIIDCVINHSSIWADKTEVIATTIEGHPMYREKPIYNWILANPVLYEKPILNVKGKLSFWEFEKPEESEFCECSEPMQSLFPNGQYRCVNLDCGKVWYH